VEVGEIERLEIQNGLARVSMRLVDNVVLWDDAWAVKRARSLLGDGYVEILPGGPPDGSDTFSDGAAHHRLASGEPIPHVVEGASTERVLRIVANSLPRVDSAVASANERLLDARRWVTGPFTQGWEGVDRWLATIGISSAVESASGGAEALAAWAERTAVATANAADQADPVLTKITDQLDDAAAALLRARTDIHDTLAGARNRMDDLDSYLARAGATIDEYAGGVPTERQGTLARLITSDDLGQQIDETTAGVEEFTRGLTRAISFLGLRTEYNVLSGLPRLYVVAEIATRNDRFFLIEAEKGGLGRLPITSLSDELGQDTWTLRSQIDEGIRFSLQWGKRLGPARFRLGIKESAFGVGTDLELLNDRLRLSVDLFESQLSRIPKLKLAASLEIFRYVYVVAGIDDALNRGRYLPIAPWPPANDVPLALERVHFGRDYFIGGMVNITDADLATMLRVYGAVLVASLLPDP